MVVEVELVVKVVNGSSYSVYSFLFSIYHIYSK